MCRSRRHPSLHGNLSPRRDEATTTTTAQHLGHDPTSSICIGDEGRLNRVGSIVPTIGHSELLRSGLEHSFPA